jgi:hypothetical protein
MKRKEYTLSRGLAVSGDGAAAPLSALRWTSRARRELTVPLSKWLDDACTVVTRAQEETAHVDPEDRQEKTRNESTVILD